MAGKLVLCDCRGSQKIDAERLARSSGHEVSKVYTELCGRDRDAAAREMAEDGAVFCCAQEIRFFEDLAAEIDGTTPRFLDLRDRAGWTKDSGDTGPKMAALVAEAGLPAAPAKSIDVESEGLCLVLGTADVAIPAAERLKDALAVTVLLTDASDPPQTRDYDVIRGRLRQAGGSLGRFSLRIDALQEVVASGRAGFAFSDPQDGAETGCDIILDLSGGTPLFSAPDKRDGYLRADPGRPDAVAQAVFEAGQLVGTFEKPLHVRVESLLCAHSRAEQTGCTRCLDACPTGAITPAGEHVSVDPLICAGCGACSSLCPSGAISYDAPPVDHTFRRVQTLARAYLEAGGAAPRLLVVDAHGSDMVRMAARFGDGLPADVVPLDVPALASFGHAEALAGLAAGFSSVVVLVSPKADRDTLGREMALARAIAGGGVTLLDIEDPDRMSESLYADAPVIEVAERVRPLGTRRQITRLAAKALRPGAEMVDLPVGAPYGAVVIDPDACTLCLSCVSLCPSGALGDNPDLPQVRFQEDACLQCGLCANICPEDAITLSPRLNLTDTALDQVVLNEDTPFACTECGALFGSTRTITQITERLKGHSMFQNDTALKMLRMCDNCRVGAQYHSENNPFAGGERPRPRTTDDYFSDRKDH